MAAKQWFEVDRNGLRQLVDKRPRGTILAELIQNAWDENTTTVRVDIDHLGGGYHNVRVADDAPDGFADLRDAFTLLAPSRKTGDAEKRGRFNLGEKLVLALCRRARIDTTTGSVVFDSDGVRRSGRRRTEAGSIFTAEMRLTKRAAAEAVDYLDRLLPPPGIDTVIHHNGKRRTIKPRKPFALVRAVLPTEIAGDDGTLRPTARNTAVEIYKPRDGEAATLYEMGIPVVETGDRYHVNVLQKVPLNMDRDNVTPAYLRKVRTLVFNETARYLDSEEMAAPWVQHASGDDKATPEAVREFVKKRFGDKAVAYDMSDREANNKAVASGHVVIHGRNLSAAQWANVKAAEAVKPAGAVFPTDKVHTSPDGVRPLLDSNLTDGMREVAEHARRLARVALGVDIGVAFYPMGGKFAASFGGGTLSFYVNSLGRKWFDWHGNRPAIVSLLIHEFGHCVEPNHLSTRYHDALCNIGAALYCDNQGGR